MHFSIRHHNGSATTGRVPALRMRGLRKQFGDTVVVDGFTLDVPRGCVFELVGPSGAGKSTVVDMVAGLLPPDEGRIDVFGLDVWDEPAGASALTGVLLDQTSVPAGVTGKAWLINTGLARGLSAVTAMRRANEMLEACGLTGAGGRQVGDYSPGMHKRLCLAAALVHEPEVLAADEPFEGVDKESATRIAEVLRDFVESNGTVLLTGRTARLSGSFPRHLRTIGGDGGPRALPRAVRTQVGDSRVPSLRPRTLSSAAC